MTSDAIDIEKHPAILGIRADGFLSDAIVYMIPALRDMYTNWFDLAQRSNQLGQQIMNSAETACAGRTTHDPICLGMRILLRSLSGFQGSILLAERGMSIEALTLVRGLYENAMWLGYLMQAPAEAVDALLLDEQRSERGRNKAILAQLERADAPDPALKSQLENQVAAADQALKGKRGLRIEELANKGDFADFYMFYKMLSSGSAHLSLHSLSKHIDINPDGTWSGHFTGPDGKGMEQALNLGCHALLLNLAAFNGIWPSDDSAKNVQGLLEEHLILSGVRDAG